MIKNEKSIPSIIPQSIFNNDKLSSGAKVMYGVLNFLSRKNGFSFAGTRYLARQLNRSTRSIQYYIAELYDHNLIAMDIIDGVRHLTPVTITSEASSEVASFIPPEVVKNKKISMGAKITYGYLSYKSNNINGYYAYQDKQQLKNELYVSESTVYRHLRVFKDLKIVRYQADNKYTRIYTKNSFINSQKHKFSDQAENLDPPENKSTLTENEINILRQLVGK